MDSKIEAAIRAAWDEGRLTDFRGDWGGYRELSRELSRDDDGRPISVTRWEACLYPAEDERRIIRRLGSREAATVILAVTDLLDDDGEWAEQLDVRLEEVLDWEPETAEWLVPEDGEVEA